MATVNCPNCGRVSPEGTRFCGGCGKPIPQAQPNVPVHPQAPAQPVQPQAPVQPVQPQPQYYAPPQGYQAPGYHQPIAKPKSGNAGFIISLILGVVGILLTMIYLVIVVGNAQILLNNLSNNLMSYLVSLLLPVVMMLIVRDDSKPALKKGAFFTAIGCLGLQCIFAIFYAILMASNGMITPFIGRVCGANLFFNLFNFVRPMFHGYFRLNFRILILILASVCFFAKNIVLCLTVGKKLK